MMGSMFIHGALAAGVALAAIPVILHLFMKQTPKHVIFPALRLIKKRQERSKKRLRIKNWLLLLARMALIALMALALARPRYDAKTQAGDTQVESAIALVFDTSLSMSYTDPETSLLQKAKTMAGELLERSHGSSEVFVIDSARVAQPVALTPASARKAIDALDFEPANQALNQALGVAYGAVVGSDKPRRQVYVFTDLAQSSWGLNQHVANLEKTKQKNVSVGTYLINLGPPASERHDVAIVRVEPSSGVVGQDETVPIKATLRATGKAAQRRVEFFVDGRKRDVKVVDVPANSEVEVPPFMPRLGQGMHRIDILLDGEPDPLPFNDAYYLTFEVKPASKVLILTDQEVDASFVENMLDPASMRNRPDVPRPYHVEVQYVARADIENLRRSLSNYTAVFLLNARSPSAELWQALGDYVRRGGGLVIGVGDHVASDLEAYNTPAPAQAVMPARLGPVLKHDELTFGRADLASELFAVNTQETLSELGRVPVYKTMPAEPVGDARTLLWYSDDTPALLERVLGTEQSASRGRVLLWTTALARVPQQNLVWNEFPIANWSWAQVMLQTIPYLSGNLGQKLAIEAGDTVMLPIEPGQRLTDVNARPPGPGKVSRLGDPPAGRSLVVTTRNTNLKPAEMLGQWTVTAERQDGPPLELGFSVNPPTSESDLAPLEPALFEPLLGKDHYQVADSLEGLIKAIDIGTVGREVFPWIMMLILLVVTLENALANMFYRERTNTPTGPTIVRV